MRLGLALTACCLISVPAVADPAADVQRALIEREQRSEELNLRLQQAPTPGNAQRQQELDRLHLQQIQRLQMLDAQQLRQFDATRQLPAADPAAADMLLRQQQQSFERERRQQLQQFRLEEQGVRHAPLPPRPNVYPN